METVFAVVEVIAIVAMGIRLLIADTTRLNQERFQKRTSMDYSEAIFNVGLFILLSLTFLALWFSDVDDDEDEWDD